MTTLARPRSELRAAIMVGAASLLLSCQAGPSGTLSAAASSAGPSSSVASTAVAHIATDPEVIAQRREAGLPLFDYDTSGDLGLTTGDPVGFQHDLALIDVSYESPAGGRVTGFLMLPSSAERPAPAVILQHGLPGEARDMLDLAIDLGMAGVASLTIDAPFARAGRSGSSGGAIMTFTAQDRDELIQMIVDLRRAVDVLASRPEIDQERIGYLGYSYGAGIGALLAGVEHRIAALVLMVGDAGLVQHFAGPPADPAFESLDPSRQAAWIAEVEPIEAIYYLPAATAPLLVMNARHDELVEEDAAQRLHDAAPEHAELAWYDSGHQLPLEAYCRAATWLGEHLAFSSDLTGMCASL